MDAIRKDGGDISAIKPLQEKRTQLDNQIRTFNLNQMLIMWKHDGSMTFCLLVYLFEKAYSLPKYKEGSVEV